MVHRVEATTMVVVAIEVQTTTTVAVVVVVPRLGQALLRPTILDHPVHHHLLECLLVRAVGQAPEVAEVAVEVAEAVVEDQAVEADNLCTLDLCLVFILKLKSYT